MSHNIETTIKAGKLVISIDLKGKVYESGSGKSDILGSTQGNISVAGSGVPAGLKVGVNVYIPKSL